MPGKAAKITITERQQEILRTLRKRRHGSLAAPANAPPSSCSPFEGHRNEEIAQEVGLAQGPVGLWRRRWARAFGRLIHLECSETRAKLRRAIEAVLSDEQRPGAPRPNSPPSRSPRSSPSPASPPEKSGRPMTHWTAHELADEVVTRGNRHVDLAVAGGAPTSARPPCSRTRVGTGSIPPRRTR